MTVRLVMFLCICEASLKDPLIITIITLLKSLSDTLLIGETKSNQIKSNQMLVFGERGKREYTENREPTNSTHL